MLAYYYSENTVRVRKKKRKCFAMTQFTLQLFKLLLTISFFFIMYLLSTKFGIWSSTIKTHLFSVKKIPAHSYSFNLLSSFYQNTIPKGRLKHNLYQDKYQKGCRT